MVGQSVGSAAGILVPLGQLAFTFGREAVDLLRDRYAEDFLESIAPAMVGPVISGSIVHSVGFGASDVIGRQSPVP